MTADTMGGVWTYAIDFARGLAARHVRTTLVILGPPPSAAQCAAAGAIPGLRLVELGGELDWTASSSVDVDMQGIRLAMLAAELRPDVVHLNSPALAAHARFPCPVVAGSHSCIRTWWMAVKGEAPLPANLLWRSELAARGYAAADLLLSPTAAFAEATQAAYALPASPRVVFNGRPPLAEAPVCAAAPEGPFAFIAGRLWDEGKGMKVLDEAAAAISAPVLAAGALSGPNGAAIRLAHARPLGQLSQAQMASWLAARPVFVSPALYEPFGLAVLEAAMAGCPLVLSDIPTFRELWDGAAVFTPAGDAAALAQAVQALLADADRRHAAGEAARNKARLYTLDAMIEDTLTVYGELVAAAQMRRGAA